MAKLKKSILAEHGFSALVSVSAGGESRSILFDFGFSKQGAAYNADAWTPICPGWKPWFFLTAIWIICNIIETTPDGFYSEGFRVNLFNFMIFVAYRNCLVINYTTL